MSIILFGKLFVGGISIGAVSVGSIFLHKHLNKEPETISISGSFIVLAEESEDGKVDSSIFECKLAEEDESLKFKCKIEKLNWVDDKKHLDYSSITKVESATKENLKETNNIFKITIKKDQYDKFKNTLKNMEIISVSDKQKYTDLRVLFTVGKDDKAIGQAEYFVAKAPSSTNLSTLSATEKYQCALESSSSEFKDCEIYDFAATDNADNGYSRLIFQKPESTTKSAIIAANKHYLIKFTEAATPTDNNLNKKQIVFIKKAADAQTTSVEFKNIQPSFLIGDKLLILGSQSQ